MVLGSASFKWYRQAVLMCCAVGVAGGQRLKLVARRPSALTWKRTQCGSPSGQHPAIPPQPFTPGVDYPGADMARCTAHEMKWENGCVMQHDASPAQCETRCNNTVGCVAYVWAPANCSGQNGPVCWLKSSATTPHPRTGCRDSRILGQPASNGTDIPTKWGAKVSAESTPLPEYPRPQMIRGNPATTRVADYRTSMNHFRDNGDQRQWVNLNGLWEWEPANIGDDAAPPFGKTLNSSILVPFPVESCLSGVAPQSSAAIVTRMWYRLTFDATAESGTQLLHFGAVDWNTTVYFNGKYLGGHVGGFDGFTFDVTTSLQNTNNELLVYVYDPSDKGKQPNGKQRISAISAPGGDTYTPSSGIWQTVWLENAPTNHIVGLTINQASTHTVIITSTVASGASEVTYTVKDMTGSIKAEVHSTTGSPVNVSISNPELWCPENPNLYDLIISTPSDTVTAYFGLRTFELGSRPTGKVPLLNGKREFAAGFLDQSFWPDGLYTAPSDEALAYDVQVVPMFGLNMIRLHQKKTVGTVTMLLTDLDRSRYGQVNSERWYYHADRIGVLIFQDAPQKYGGASSETIPFFVHDLKAMIQGRGNHPCIVQYETFNEGDCWAVFKDAPYDVPGIVSLARELDWQNRLIDTDSGGGANNLHIGDVDDIHSYPWPGNPTASNTQYAMVGEFGGLGAFQAGHMWTANGCFAYDHSPTAHDQATTYIAMAGKIQANVDHISASVYTQTTDLERECDGFLNYDRTNKFSDEDTAAIKSANLALRHAAV